MNYYEILFNISYLFNTVILLILTVYVFLKNHKNPIYRTYALYSLSIAWWSFFSIFLINASAESEATFWDRVCLIGAIFIPTTFMHFIATFLQLENKKKLIYLLYCTSIFFVFLDFTPYFIVKTAPIFLLSFFTVPALGYYVFLIFFIFTYSYVVFLIFKSFLIEKDLLRKRQLKYLFSFTVIGYIGGALNFNLVLRIPPYDLVPWGNALIGLYGLGVGYIIVRYQFMDIKIIIKKSLVYSLLVASNIIIYLLFVVLVERVFYNFVGYQNIAATVLTSGIIAIIFIPLRNKIQSFVDIIFFKRTPMQMAEENELLRQEVVDVEKYKTVAALAGSIAHEVNNPLTSLLTFSEYLPQKKNDPEFMEKFEKIIPKEITRLNILMTGLLTLAKPSAPKKESINPNDIIKSSIDLLQQPIKTKNISVTMKLSDSNTTIQGDPNQIKQVLINLILNAIDAMKDKGQITIRTWVDHKDYFIEVEDTGTGIDPKDVPNIFSPFFTKKAKGTGLGLFITKEIIEKHGGRISVKSVVNQGTIFKMTISF